MAPLLNNTKWDELRLAMYDLGPLRPKWRTRDTSGHVSEWDSEWYYHLRCGGYATIEWLDIWVTSPAQDQAVLAGLRKVGVPGHATEHGYRIYGYAPVGMAIQYL